MPESSGDWRAKMARARCGFHWVYLGDDIRLKVDHPVYDFIAARVLYTKGGLDPLNCDKDCRGYYLSVLPVDKRGYGSRKDGLKIPLKAVSRRSNKSDDLAIAKGTGLAILAIADVCNKISAGYSLNDMKVVGGA